MKATLLSAFALLVTSFFLASCRTDKKEVMTVIPDTQTSAAKPHASPTP